jgi:hypothetical protein
LLILAVNSRGLEVWEYETLAQNILSGRGYIIEHFGHPTYAFGDGNLYSFLSATVYLVFGHQPFILAICQAVIASLAAPVIFMIGRRALEPHVAGVGAALAALHPGLLAYTSKLHPLGLDVLLMALVVLWIGRPIRLTRNALMLGAALGLALMSRPTFFVAGMAALGLRALLARALKPVLLAAGVGLLVAAPWIVRNAAVLGRPVFISTSLEDVWKGNNPLASGSSYLADGQDVFSVIPPEVRARFEQASELELNDIFAAEILSFVSAQPAEFATLTARKFVYFWSLPPQVGLMYPSSWLMVYEVYFAIVAVLAIVGAGCIIRDRNVDEQALLSTLVVIALVLATVHALSYVEGRHRWGIEPLLLLLTARGIFALAGPNRAIAGRIAPGQISITTLFPRP